MALPGSALLLLSSSPFLVCILISHPVLPRRGRGRPSWVRRPLRPRGPAVGKESSLPNDHTDGAAVAAEGGEGHGMQESYNRHE